LSRIFQAIRKFPVRIISQSSSARNVTLVVDKKDDWDVVEALYKELFRK
jgi:aspartokinase